MEGTPGKTPGPEQMRTAMAAYVTGVHESYVQTASILPPAVRGSLRLLQGHFTVVAAGVGNLAPPSRIEGRLAAGAEFG